MKKLISEDEKIYNSQRQVQGMKNQTDPQANQVSTFLNRNNSDNSQAPINRPYPLDLHDDILSNMYIDMMNYKKMLGNALENPALKTEQRPVLKEIDSRINIIN